MKATITLRHYKVLSYSPPDISPRRCREHENIGTNLLTMFWLGSQKVGIRWQDTTNDIVWLNRAENDMTSQSMTKHD